MLHSKICIAYRDFLKCYWQLFSFAFKFKSKTLCISCFTLFYLQLFRCFWGNWRYCQGWSGTTVFSCSFYLISSAYLHQTGLDPVSITLERILVVLLLTLSPVVQTRESVWRMTSSYSVQMVSWDIRKQVIHIRHVHERDWQLNVSIKILNVVGKYCYYVT